MEDVMTRYGDFIRVHFLDRSRIPSTGAGASAWCSIVTNQENGVVSYASGVLGYHPRPEAPDGRVLHPLVNVAKFTGELAQVFSDPQRPFGESRVDQLGIDMVVDPDGQLVIRVTALSWGSGRSELHVLGCDAQVLYAMGPGIGAHIPAALYAISLGVPVANPG